MTEISKSTKLKSYLNGILKALSFTAFYLAGFSSAMILLSRSDYEQKEKIAYLETETRKQQTQIDVLIERSKAHDSALEIAEKINNRLAVIEQKLK